MWKLVMPDVPHHMHSVLRGLPWRRGSETKRRLKTFPIRHGTFMICDHNCEGSLIRSG